MLSRSFIAVAFAILFSVSGFSQNKGIEIPFTLHKNHIFIDGLVNDTLPASILLDCGAGTFVSARLAEQGQMKTRPYGETIGVGDQTAPMQMGDSSSFTLGSLRYVEKNTPVIAMGAVDDCASRISVEKNGYLGFKNEPDKDTRKIDAVIGDKFFRRFVVKVDFQNEMMTVYEPSIFHYAGKGQRIPLEYSDNHIYAMANLQISDSLSIPGRFMVDCGSVTGLVLTTSFIEEHELRPPAYASEFSVCGIGGSSNSWLGYFPGFQLGENKISKPVVLFSGATGGVLTRPDIAGLIGNGILNQFTVIFDYSRRELILEGN